MTYMYISFLYVGAGCARFIGPTARCRPRPPANWRSRWSSPFPPMEWMTYHQSWRVVMLPAHVCFSNTIFLLHVCWECWELLCVSRTCTQWHYGLHRTFAKISGRLWVIGLLHVIFWRIFPWFCSKNSNFHLSEWMMREQGTYHPTAEGITRRQVPYDDIRAKIVLWYHRIVEIALWRLLEISPSNTQACIYNHSQYSAWFEVWYICWMICISNEYGTVTH